MNRLTSDTVNGSTTSYTYDATGNRTSKIVAGATYTNTVDANSNKLTQTSDVTGTVSPSYDSAGNTTGDGTNTYAYSDRGRMASATTPSGNVTFLYNGLDLRASKTSSAGSTYYVYDEGGNLLGEYDGSGNAIYETVYLKVESRWTVERFPFGTSATNIPGWASFYAVGVIKQGNAHNLYVDQSDTPRVITKQDHTIVWRWDTAEAFGATAPNQDPSGLGAFVFNQRFPGQVFDIETGLNQNWNREYDPRIGGYKQVDPIGLRGGINPFAYVGGRPLTSIDPRGLAAIDIPLPDIPLPDIPLPDWIRVPGARVLGGIGLILSLSGDTPRPDANDQCPPGPGDPCKGLRDQLEDHERKLRQYISDPMSMDNKGFLAAALGKGYK